MTYSPTPPNYIVRLFYNQLSGFTNELPEFTDEARALTFESLMYGLINTNTLLQIGDELIITDLVTSLRHHIIITSRYPSSAPKYSVLETVQSNPTELVLPGEDDEYWSSVTSAYLDSVGDGPLGVSDFILDN